MLDLATVEQPRKPNQYLVLPAGFGRARPHRVAPEFAAPAPELAQAIRTIALGGPRVSLRGRSDDGLSLELVQRSALFRFPDLVDIQVVPAGAARSTLAIYSRSVYGQLDFGVNRRRVEDWLARLAAAQGSFAQGSSAQGGPARHPTPPHPRPDIA